MAHPAPAPPSHPLSVAPTTRRQRLRRVLPFVAALLVSLGLAALPPGEPSRFVLLGAAAIGLVACGVTIVALPWPRVPEAIRLLPVGMFCISVAIIRDATSTPQGRSGFAVLLLLAVVWQASYGRRVELAATLGLVLLTLTIPIVAIGPPAYPASEWRNAAILTFTGAIVGGVVQRLVWDLRRERALVTTVARIGRTVAAGEDPRRSLCQATLDLTGVRVVLLLEPDGPDRGLRVTEAAGTGLARRNLPPDVVGEAERTARAIADHVAADASQGRAPVVVESPSPEGPLALCGWLHQPVERDGSVRVVLSVAWDRPASRPRDTHRAALELLAAEAAAALDRADLLGQLDQLAREDPLTGLVNRRAWDSLLEREVARSERTRQPMTVAIIDLDHFKVFNDRHGHLVGDQLLKAAAASWSAALRGADVLCRWGGEEFAVLMPDTPPDVARQVLARLAATTPMQQTFSAGFVTHVGPVDPETLMTGADVAVYRAKRAGRDRIEEGRPAPRVTLAEPVALDLHPGGPGGLAGGGGDQPSV